MSANGWKIVVGAEGAEDQRGKVYVFERGDYLSNASWQTYSGSTAYPYANEKRAGYKLVAGYFSPQVQFPTASGLQLKKWAQRQVITKVVNQSYFMSRDPYDRFGTTVCLSGDGNVLAIGTGESSPPSNLQTIQPRWSTNTTANIGRVYMYLSLIHI